MCNPSKQEITAIEAELLEEQGREVEWESRSDWADNADRDWFRKDDAFHEHVDHMITRQMDFN